MKKSLLLIASAALLLVGCAKEKLGPDAGSGEMVNITISAQVQGDELTKAAIDNDGNGVNANRCIMVLYYGEQVYGRYQAAVSGYHATFDVKVPAKRTYKAVFWADCAAEDGGDLYYNTADLKNITLKSAYVGNNDKRDAFFVCEDYTVDVQTNKSFTATLKRPFAQINVISNDIQYLHLPTLYPQKVNLSFLAPVSFNAMSGECGEAAAITYETDVYKAFDDTKQQLTLSMDYLFAGSRAAVDIEFKAPTEGTMKVEYSFTNIPYERNYRTNIIGNLLTADAHWDVTIAPAWDQPDYDVPYYEASSISDAQEYISTSNPEEVKAVDLSNVVPTINDFDSTSEDKTIKFELKNYSPNMVNFTLPAIPAEVLEAGCTGWKITHESYYHTENVNVTAPAGTSVTIDAPRSHVTLNGVEYQNVTATTGQNTLVVPAGINIMNLTVIEGAVEIHGTVENLTVSPAEGKTIVFRECEGLSAEVFAKIYSTTEPVCNYIDPMYAFEQVDGKYNIYKLPVVAMIGEDEYPSLASAINAVKDNDIIVLTKDVENAVGLTVNTGKTFTVDFNGHTYTLNKPGAGSAGTEVNAFQLLQGQKVTFKNGKIEVSPDNLTPATVGKNIMRLIQGYAELVLEDMVLDATNLYESNALYVCSFNNQPVTLKGNTSIIGLREGFTAFDSDGNWDGYARCQVTIDTKGTIAGPIELGQGFIEIKDVVLLGAINLCTSCGASETEGQMDRITIKGGTFSVDPSAYVKSPYEVKENGDGTFSVV